MSNITICDNCKTPIKGDIYDAFFGVRKRNYSEEIPPEEAHGVMELLDKILPEGSLPPEMRVRKKEVVEKVKSGKENFIESKRTTEVCEKCAKMLSFQFLRWWDRVEGRKFDLEKNKLY